VAAKANIVPLATGRRVVGISIRSTRFLRSKSMWNFRRNWRQSRSFLGGLIGRRSHGRKLVVTTFALTVVDVASMLLGVAVSSHVSKAKAFEVTLVQESLATPLATSLVARRVVMNGINRSRIIE
jgi:hypothetical protein